MADPERARTDPSNPDNPSEDQGTPDRKTTSREPPDTTSQATRPGDDTTTSDVPPSKGSSIRPMPADWQPPASQPRVPSPMVVVYSGESDRPPPLWDIAASERPTRTDFRPDTPAQPFSAVQEHSGSESRSTAARSGRARNRLIPARHQRLLLLGALACFAGVLGFAWQRARNQRAGSESSMEAAPSAEATTTEFKPLGSAETFGPSPTQKNDLPTQGSARTRIDPATSSSARAPLPSPSPRKATVLVRVYPPDSVIRGRRGRVPGPPYTFEVPRGKRIAIEVSRPGYVTRRAVLDGTDTDFWVGLVKKEEPTPP